MLMIQLAAIAMMISSLTPCWMGYAHSTWVIILSAIITFPPISVSTIIVSGGSAFYDAMVCSIFAYYKYLIFLRSMMMNFCLRGDILAKHSFSDQNMLLNISVPIRSWMPRHPYPNISIQIFSLSALPIRVIGVVLTRWPAFIKNMPIYKPQRFVFYDAIFRKCSSGNFRSLSAPALTVAVRNRILGLSHDICSLLAKVKVRAVEVLQHFFGSFFYSINTPIGEL